MGKVYYTIGHYVALFKNTDQASGQINGVFYDYRAQESIIVGGRFDNESIRAAKNVKFAVAIEDSGKTFKNMRTYWIRHLCEYQTEPELLKWLGSADFKGVGQATARKLLDFTKNYAGSASNFKNICMVEPTVLYGSGVKSSTCDMIANVVASGVSSIASIRARFPFITVEMANEIVKSIGNDFWIIVQTSPYDLMDIFSKFPWATFARIDRIALAAGVDRASPERIAAGVYHLTKAELISRGDTRFPMSDKQAWDSVLYAILRGLQLDGSFFNQVEAALLSEISLGSRICKVTEKGVDYCCIKRLYDAEAKTAKIINHLVKSEPLFDGDMSEILTRMNEYEVMTGISLDMSQQMAVVMAIKSRIGVITGGPGRGKTSVLACIAYIWATLGMRNDAVMPMAPTWLAAHRIDDSLSSVVQPVKDYQYKNSMAAAGVYRGIQKAQAVAKVICNAEKKRDAVLSSVWNNLKVTEYCGLVIIDEASMLDIKQIADLLEFYSESHIVLLGDTNQLPSIGPGFVLGGICSYNTVPKIELTVNYRSNRYRALGENTDKIRNGCRLEELDWSSDCFMMQSYDHIQDGTMADPLCMQQYIVDRYAYYLNEAITLGERGLRDVVILGAYNKAKHGLCSVESLNLAVQDRVNPEKKRPATVSPITDVGVPMPKVKYGERPIRVGDRVMYRRNDPEKGITNGDCGIVRAFRPPDGKNLIVGEVYVRLDDGRDIKLQEMECEYLELAYAITVHKSQGCEFRYVIFSAQKKLQYDRMNFANRNLFYTAATRTKKQFEIVGYTESVRHCMGTELLPRCSGLANLLEKFA